MSTSPLLTIITVVWNAKEDIEKTFQSIEKIKDNTLQYIVLDGGSTDGTIDIINRYGHIIDYAQSQKDGGIYHAMNTALQFAQGTYVLNINAGDELLHYPYKTLLHALEDNIQLACFPVLLDNETIHSPIWNSNLSLYNTLPHQGCCYQTVLFEQYRYDIRYHVFADFDLNQRLFQQQIKTQIYETIIASHDMHGVSNQPQYGYEMLHIIYRNFGLRTLLVAWLRFKKEGLKQRLKKLF